MPVGGHRMGRCGLPARARRPGARAAARAVHDVRREDRLATPRRRRGRPDGMGCGGAGHRVHAVRAGQRRPDDTRHHRRRALRRRPAVCGVRGVRPGPAAGPDDAAGRPALERRLGPALHRHLPRRTVRLLLHDQRAGHAGRWTGRGGRRHQRQHLGRPLGVGDAGDRLRVHRRDRDSARRLAISGRRRPDVGHQLRPEPTPDAGTRLLVRTGRPLGADVTGGRPRRPGSAATDPPAPGDSVRADRGTGRRVARRRHRTGCAVCRHPADLRLWDGEPGLRDDRSGPGTDQPDAVRAEPGREAPVLPGGAGAVQSAYPDLLLPPDRRHHRRGQGAG